MPKTKSTIEDCFIIMPITEHADYPNNHFKRVYQDIIKPACQMASYNPVRADDILETNFIHLDILKRLIESPMAICDLSSRNPNVLFELGLRQAFDKPVVLIQEKGTPKIFDIAPLRYTDYHKQRVYHEVLEDQKKIKNALESTRDATKNQDGVNSIVKLLSLSPANIKDISPEKTSPILQIIRAEINELRNEFRRNNKIAVDRDQNYDIYYEKLDEAEHNFRQINAIFNKPQSMHNILGNKNQLNFLKDRTHILLKEVISNTPSDSPEYVQARELYYHLKELDSIYQNKNIETTEKC